MLLSLGAARGPVVANPCPSAILVNLGVSRLLNQSMNWHYITCYMRLRQMPIYELQIYFFLCLHGIGILIFLEQYPLENCIIKTSFKHCF